MTSTQIMKLKPKAFTSGLTAEAFARRDATRAFLAESGWTPVRDLREADLFPDFSLRGTLERGRPVHGTVPAGRLSEVSKDIFDHPYTLRHESGLLVHVGEPYPAPLESALPDLPALCGTVYKFVVRPDMALHNPVPGGTTAVWVYDVSDAKAIEALLPELDEGD